MNRFLLLTIALVAVFGLSGCSYNDLTAQQQGVRGKWANVESALQRRADLIPNLVKAAQMSGIQEQEVFGQIADARSRLLTQRRQRRRERTATKRPSRNKRFRSEKQLRRNVGRLLSLQENYPVLRSSELFQTVQTELAGTENRINVARLDYNDAVTRYNTSRNQFRRF
jgi:LemA protein